MSKYSDLRDTMAPSNVTLLSEAQPHGVEIDLVAHESPRPIWRQVLQAAAHVVRRWRENAKARRELARLDSRSLREIGISPELADFEASRPFWHAPRDLRH